MNRSRPLSADNIRYVNRQNFVDDYRSEITISSRNRSRDEGEKNNRMILALFCFVSFIFDCFLSYVLFENRFRFLVDMAETSTLSGNIYENILNRYSENKLVEQCAKRESVSNLKPGLSSKPPLPPFADIKMHANKSEPEPQPEPEPETVEQTVESEENLKTAAEREAFDEIIALKFQRWFPNTTGLGHDHNHDHMEGSSSGDGEIDDVELVSYKERNYKTCEYRRYEVHRKNTTRKIAETGNGDTNASKHGVKKRRPPKGKVVSSTIPSFDNDAAPHTGHRKHSACETDAIATSQPLDNGNGDGDCDNASQINQQRDGRKLADKADELRKKKRDTTATATYSSALVPVPVPKASSFKKSNFQSLYLSPSKKQKKISFFVDKANDEGTIRTDDPDEEDSGNGKGNGNDNNDDFVETYFAKKKSQLHVSSHKSPVCGQSVVNNERCSCRDSLSDTPPKNNRNTTISPQQPAGSQIEDVLSWMCTHRNVQADTNCNSVKKKHIHIKAKVPN